MDEERTASKIGTLRAYVGAESCSLGGLGTGIGVDGGMKRRSLVGWKLYRQVDAPTGTDV